MSDINERHRVRMERKKAIIDEKIAKAEDALRRGGVLQPFPGNVATVERADLDRHFSGWMAEADAVMGRHCSRFPRWHGPVPGSGRDARGRLGQLA